MHIHILGICGTFMGGVAVLAKAAGHHVSGSDEQVYPPMSDVLANSGIDIYQGYDTRQFSHVPDLVIIGNALSRGNPAVEYVLNNTLPYVSGAQWLGEQFLYDREVIAIAGTHGKTTTTAMLTWILSVANKDPGYLIGGRALDFNQTAYAGTGPFVIEADEYDTAFFDKRAKFVHYRPRICILNNLEFDHADIYSSLDAIKTQFHHLVRTVPGNGQLILNNEDINLKDMLSQGLWSEKQTFGTLDSDWSYKLLIEDGSCFSVFHQQEPIGDIHWAHTGVHNIMNALAAIGAAHTVGVEPLTALQALNRFQGVKRRMELLYSTADLSVYDDFAHHPTAIKTTLNGVRRRIGKEKLVVVLELRSNTMLAGHHRDTLATSLADADVIALKTPDNLEWDASVILDGLSQPVSHFTDTDKMLNWLLESVTYPAHIVFMSNGGFDAAPARLVKAVST